MHKCLSSLVLCLLTFGCNSTLSPEEARKELGRMNVQYSEDSYLTAAKNGDLTSVDLFLKSGMPVDARDSRAYTVYNYLGTAPNDDTAISIRVRLDLIERGYIEADFKKGTTALMLASAFGRSDVVGFLLSKGADINATDHIGLTSLIYAAWRGQKEIVSQLLSAGADASIKGGTNITATTAARSAGHAEIIQLLKQGSDTDEITYDQPPPKAIPQTEAQKIAFAKATDIKNRADKGEDFASLAQKYSDAGSKDKGGLYDFFPRGTMVPQFEQAAFSLKHGEVSDIVATEYGYHIIKCEDRRQDEVKVRHILIMFK